MKYSSGTEKLGLPEYIKFGIEIEADNVQTNGKNGLYKGISAEFISNKKWHMASGFEESLVLEGGAELDSPVLTDSENTWKDLIEMCEHIKLFPGKKGDKVVVNEKCGLHVHFDSTCLTENPKVYSNFLKIYAEAEELIYKMCNEKNHPIRRGAINKSFRGLRFISSLWRTGMAAPSGRRILEQIKDGKLKVSHKKFGRLKMIASIFKMDERRYRGLNLSNIGNVKKNTIEFRMSNGTLNPEVIKQNVFLYASIVNTAIQMIEHPEKYTIKKESFYRTDINEEQKAIRFLNLIMENEEDKQIFIERWRSVKDAPVFKDIDKKGVAQGRFRKASWFEEMRKTD
ncbi:MAG: amidoligase family protein [Clostridia bacterium]|nr:amidoligase family protein [Clostridia bacterium]